MSNSKDFIAHVVELIRPAAASAKPMFGGPGIYIDQRIVALVVDDTLYIKTDDQTRPRFTDAGRPPFAYAAHDGAMHQTRYYPGPDEALDSPLALADWIRLGADAAMRRSASTRPRKRSAAKSRAKS